MGIIKGFVHIVFLLGFICGMAVGCFYGGVQDKVAAIQKERVLSAH